MAVCVVKGALVDFASSCVLCEKGGGCEQHVYVCVLVIARMSSYIESATLTLSHPPAAAWPAFQQAHHALARVPPVSLLGLGVKFGGPAFACMRGEVEDGCPLVQLVDTYP